MCILGAIFTDTVVVQQLTGYVWTGGNPDNDKELEFLARLFKALSFGLRDLQMFYGGLDITLNSQRFFPFRCSYPDSLGQEVEFRYIDRLSGNKAIYLAESNDRKLIIKFVQRYNPHAHHLLANADFAPQLHYSSLSLDHAEMNTAGELGMVVMDFVEGMDAYKMYPDGQLPDTIYDQVKTAVEILHENSLVFGDLRLLNVIITEQQKPMLIDFDWCGLDNTGRYPISLNDVQFIAWHKDVERNGIMHKEHDISMLYAMKKQP